MTDEGLQFEDLSDKERALYRLYRDRLIEEGIRIVIAERAALERIWRTRKREEWECFRADDLHAKRARWRHEKRLRKRQSGRDDLR
ncbi:MAG TPA: hypothetical protein ENJ50_06755 [Planctomycetaceae bacterium]|nr:hypothetical protein [Planctomycetaceae bacterium]